MRSRSVRMASNNMSTAATQALNPRYLRFAYISFFSVQSLDCILFLTLSPQLFPPSVLSPSTRFFISADATTLFPLVLLVYLLRDQHISSPVGKRVALAFCVFHTMVLGLVFWARLYNEYWLEPFWAAVAFHAAWLACGLAALVSYP
jgi:hypothetical protein